MADKYELVPEFLKVKGLVQNQLDSFDYFIRTQLKKIVLSHGTIVSTQDPNLYLRYEDVHVGKVIGKNYACEPAKLSPQIARLSGLSYAAPIVARIKHAMKKDNKIKTIEQDVTIGWMPVMLRSRCCVLYDKDEDQLARLGECPLDPGGYFIIKGIERVFLIQEQLRKNHIMVQLDQRGCVQASVVSSTEKTESTAVIKMKEEKIYLKLHQFKRKVPIMIVMRAMGMQSDQEVLQMIGRDPRFSALLLPSIGECNTEFKVFTQQQALEFLDKMLKVASYVDGPPEKGGHAFSFLRDIFLAHVPAHSNNFHKKCMYVAVMLRRMMEATLNKDALDDKDYLGNKRYELSGHLLSLLFEDLFKRMNDEARKNVDARLAKRTMNDVSFVHVISQGIITMGLERSLSTGSWDVKQVGMHWKGVTQVVSRLSYIGLLSQMTKIAAQVEKSSEVSGPSARPNQLSQFGMICPCDTPGGEACGLVKHLALMTHVTLPKDEDESTIASMMELCNTLGVEDLAQFSPELHMSSSYLIILNGDILGKHRRPQKFASVMRKLRRNGRIGEFVSIFVNEKQGCVYIASDGGRVCRPLVIAEKGASRIKEHHMEELKVGLRNFDGFLRDGLVEFLDVNEENNSLIAEYGGQITPETTHIEIEPFTILGVCAGLIPYLNHNDSRSNAYQCAVGKQAMGNIAYNQLSRMDKLINLLVYPERPLLTTRTIELVGYDKLGAGQNAIVAVMSYGGYDAGNAIVMNKSSLDRGFGRCIVMKTHSAICEKYKNQTSDRIIKPQRRESEAEGMQILDDDGMAAPGEIVRPCDIYINKESPEDRVTFSPIALPDSAYKPRRRAYIGPEGETAVIDRVALYSNEDKQLCIKLAIRHTRRPEIGDQFSCRHGHKGVCGLIVQQEDLPFSERGICPDIIINPHGFPSRMTVGKMIEVLGSKAGVSSGRFHDGSAFGEPSGHADTVDSIGETLVKHGFSYNGKDFMYSGITGMPLQTYIFMGPIYYQKLKHMVLDKMHARGRGPRAMMTRQPTEGASRNGGLRVGEMERDCLIAYGASMLIYERLMVSSDLYEVQVCRKCGLLGYYHYKLKTGICSMCKNGENISTINLPYACKLLIQELQSMNIVPRLKLAES